VSGSVGGACLGGMYALYVVVTILVALANGYAASLDFVGAESVKLAGSLLARACRTPNLII
jgi:hypothetical protein